MILMANHSPALSSLTPL
jgi:hypothetical protein